MDTFLPAIEKPRGTGLDQTKESVRDARVVRWMNEFLQDSRSAVRISAKSPGFTIITVLMLALGVGANTAVSSVYDTLVFAPLPFGNIDRLVEIPPGFNYPNCLSLVILVIASLAAFLPARDAASNPMKALRTE